MKEIKVRPIVRGTVEGEAIVSPTPISFLGDIDPNNGKVRDRNNPLFGASITNKIFIFPQGKGSTVGSYVIYGLRVNEVAPLAFVVNKAETIVIAGAILANIPLFEQIEGNISKVIKNGDTLRIDSEKESLLLD